jgi:hypothetical protein
VNGYFYINDASVNQNVTTPSLGVTGHLLVLRLDTTAQTVRIALKSSSNGVSSIPTVTQSGSTWEIPLASLLITTGGVITVTDLRSYCHFATRIGIDQIDFNAPITLATSTFPAFTISGNNADQAIRIHNTGTGGRNYRIDSTSGASGYGQGSLSIIDDSASLERLRIDSSGDILKGGTLPVPAIINRQGGNAFLWENAGTTNYSPNTTTKTMIGTNSWNGTAASSGFTTINLPVGFSGTPLAFITPRSPKIVMYLQSASPTSIQFNWVTTDGSTTTGFGYQWLAIGP